MAAAAPRNDQLGIEKWRRLGLKTTGLTSQKSHDLRKIRKLTNSAEEAGVREYSSEDKLAKVSQRSTLTSTSCERSCSSIIESRKRATFER